MSSFRLALSLSSCLVLSALSARASAAPSWPSDEGRGSCRVSKKIDVPVKMRDGAILRADVYTPDTKEKVPVLLMRTQYGKSAAQVQPSRYQSPDWFASHCYIVAIQDIRGQGKSGGVFYEYRYDRDDGYDTVQWAATLPGADGQVAMYGSSYVGATQWLAATASPPALKAIIPSNTGDDYYDGWSYEDGAFRLAFIEPWMLETIASSAAANRGDEALSKQLFADGKNASIWLPYTPYSKFPPLHREDPKVAPYFYDTVAHPSRDGFWEAFQIRTHYDRVKVPVLAFDGWYDSFLNGAVNNFNGMRTDGGSPDARTHQRLIIGPWEHIGWGRPDAIVSPRLKDIGPVANSPVNALTVQFMDHVLKGKDNGFADGPRVDYFTMGENRWHVARSFPIEGTQYVPWYLGSAGRANSSMGDGTLTQKFSKQGSSSDQFVYDPSNPVPSAGGHSCCSWTSGPQGQFDQSPVEQRPDVLVYTSAPLKSPVNVTGPITVDLFAATDAKDTDFTAKLVDVAPDGRAINLNNGIIRARYRESLSNPVPIIPGKVYEYRIKVWPTSNLFQTGHRIRLEISSSDYPQFAPNPNTGEALGDAHGAVRASQTIWHDATHQSSVVLPILPETVAGEGYDHPPQD
ncbi:CocE/NonD family hydrolase [Acetobacter nitrogenifigens]|uniref:Putative peptidase n=1 Tax=Acetobacter nitrogenifigens DSM 23921 = NBRC 105050 TaxID=1120919 RepID=A0A511X7S3_9PROT|nr:CocE/NonD family hydrolase [Acetobacter nitrogenifigens]GEN58994.1 putative peptidase [Acetobacter nitrogenifigens DSM 23921 = NBRC 105050]